MSTAGKSMMVVVGLFLFFGVAVIGPIAGNATGFAARTVLGQSADDNNRNQARALNPNYMVTIAKDGTKSAPVLRAWADCCEQTCNASWNYGSDRCELHTQGQTQAFHTCSIK